MVVSVYTVPARGGRSCEHFGGYKTINRIPLYVHICMCVCVGVFLCFCLSMLKCLFMCCLPIYNRYFECGMLLDEHW